MQFFVLGDYLIWVVVIWCSRFNHIKLNVTDFGLNVSWKKLLELPETHLKYFILSEIILLPWRPERGSLLSQQQHLVSNFMSVFNPVLCA